MSATGKRFVVGFVTGTIAAAFLNLLPFLRTRGAYNGDGFEIIGFPFTFRRLGGLTGIYEFHAVALITDIALGLVVALVVGYACTRVWQRESE